MSFTCHSCSEPIDLGKENLIFRRDLCPKCNKDLRCCKNCIHYDPMVKYECKEDLEERLVDKEKSNFCELFTPKKNKEEIEEEKQKILEEALKLFK